jgi:BirA family transcriptional regulator, biotin operon repressor / biotin---[acetyl-CoA-carboxylase] ligase
MDDSLASDRILDLLKTRRIGRNVIVFKETSSTNDRIRQAGLAGAAEGLVMFAESQTSGRGTYGRKWISTPGAGLWFSILLRSELPLDQLPLLLQVGVLAVADGVEELLPEAVMIKLPNDLYLREGKLAGLLLETSNAWDFQILGIGINIRQPPEIPDYPTAAIEQFAAAPVVRTVLAARILSLFENWYVDHSPFEWSAAFNSRSQRSQWLL